MSINWPLLVEAIKAVAWPLVAGLALLLLRRQLTEVVAQVARRARKVSVFEVSVELATLPELRPSTWTAGPGDVRQLTPALVFDSYTQSLFQELLAPSEPDYALIDPGSGVEWLTSP